MKTTNPGSEKHESGKQIKGNHEITPRKKGKPFKRKYRHSRVRAQKSLNYKEKEKITHLKGKIIAKLQNLRKIGIQYAKNTKVGLRRRDKTYPSERENY